MVLLLQCTYGGLYSQNYRYELWESLIENPCHLQNRFKNLKLMQCSGAVVSGCGFLQLPVAGNYCELYRHSNSYFSKFFTDNESI